MRPTKPSSMMGFLERRDLRQEPEEPRCSQQVPLEMLVSGL